MGKNSWMWAIPIIGGLVLAFIFRCKIAEAIPQLSFICPAGQFQKNQPSYLPPSKAVQDIRNLARVENKSDPEKAVAEYLKGRAKPVRSGPT